MQLVPYAYSQRMHQVAPNALMEGFMPQNRLDAAPVTQNLTEQPSTPIEDDPARDIPRITPPFGCVVHRRMFEQRIPDYEGGIVGKLFLKFLGLFGNPLH